MTDNQKSLVVGLKDDIVKLMDGMLAFRAKYPKFGLPEPADDFKLSKELLTKGEFNLAVCGKVKNGKSSLINALIGRDLLPVCNDVATSRVFKISNAEEDKFFVVYANGDKKEITQQDLIAYGSQAVVDQNGELDLAKSIAYIQVFTKIDFLPEGVSLIDTPGVGSTYPQHTVITKQYIKMADAALFVMNPTPLEDIEVEFLKEVVNVTPGIIFITTKIDQNGNESVEESVKRNQKIIEESVGKELPFGLDILKMSSLLLMEAAHADDKDIAAFNYEISGYSEVKAAMNNLIFLVSGYYRAGMAYNASVGYYNDVFKLLQLKLDTLKKSSENYEELLAQYEEALATFKDTMGEARKKEVFKNVETILQTMGSDFNDIFSPQGDIFKKYEKEINELSSQDDIDSYSKNLSDNVMNDIQNEWQQLTSLVQKKTGAILMKFNEDCLVSIPNGLISLNNNVADPIIQDVQLRDKVSKMRNEMFLGTAITTAGWTIFQGTNFFLPALGAATAPVLWPVLTLLGVGAVLWGVISGNNKARQEALQRNKTQLIRFVSDTLTSCRKQIVETSLANNKYNSLYAGFLEAVRTTVNDTVNSIYDKYQIELESMKKTIMDSKQNAQLVPATKFLIQEWGKNTEVINSIHQKLEALKVS